MNIGSIQDKIINKIIEKISQNCRTPSDQKIHQEPNTTNGERHKLRQKNNKRILKANLEWGVVDKNRAMPSKF